MDVQCVWPLGALVGESPVWVPSEAALYFVDIYGDVLHRYHPQSGERRSQPATRRLSALVPRKSGGYLGSAAHSLGALDAQNGQLTPWHTLQDEPSSNRLNDGKCSPQGRYYTGSMDENKAAGLGNLYLLDERRELRKVDGDYVISNGPAFSPDGRTMYHADTTRSLLFVFDVEADGTPTNKRLLRQFAASEGRPDGMTCDVDGALWVAHASGSRVTRFAPTGEALQHIELPVSKVTSMAFGDADYRTLYITTAKIGLDDAALKEQPLAGGLFRVELSVQGLPADAHAS